MWFFGEGIGILSARGNGRDRVEWPVDWFAKMAVLVYRDYNQS